MTLLNTRSNTTHPSSSIKKFARNAVMLGLLGLPLLSNAQAPVQVGDPFVVNNWKDQTQRFNETAVLKDGSYVTIWTGKDPMFGQDPVFAQRFNADGTLAGTETYLSYSPSHRHNSAAISPLNDGGYATAWARYKDNSTDLVIRTFDADGTPRIDELVIKSVQMDLLGSPTVTTLSNGEFVVAWAHANPIAANSDIYAQRFLANGTPASDAFIVSNTVDYEQKLVSLTALSDGKFMASWHGRGIGDDHGVFIRTFAADGTPLTDETLVNDNSDGQQQTAAIDTLPDGSVVVTWVSLTADSTDIMVKRMNADGTPAGQQTMVDQSTVNLFTIPSVAALSDGRYVLSWQGEDDIASPSYLYTRAYNANDTATGDKVTISSLHYAGVQNQVTALSDNDYIIHWSDENVFTSMDVFGQHMTLNGGPATALTLELPQTTVLEGDTITLPLTVSGSDIYGIDASVRVSAMFDMARITGGEYGEFLPSDERLSVPMGISDKLWDGALALMAPATAKTGEGQFASIQLLAEQAGVIDLVVNAKMTDQESNYLLNNEVSYSLTIEESVTLTGNVANLGVTGDYSNVVLRINGQLVTINPDGSFSVRSPLGNVTLSLEAHGYLSAEKQLNFSAGQEDIDFGQIELVGGDSNGDNLIDIADLTQLLGAYRTKKSDNNGYVSDADFNGDNEINIQDLTLMGANFGKQGPQSW
ncbi:hypothetical protein [Pseudoalteromonas sp. PPB1]|uniref:hypothetical protein n=1 Tax=Pseudoalteromonas sp. PPB1 TaxID=2756136 RepID=UPI0018914473|nr:hypothetical protein [Pseudoalteromonas sp. PPB1]